MKRSYQIGKLIRIVNLAFLPAIESRTLRGKIVVIYFRLLICFQTFNRIVLSIKKIEIAYSKRLWKPYFWGQKNPLKY